MSEQPIQPKAENPSHKPLSTGHAGPETGSRPIRPRLRQLPPYRVLLHDDDEIEMGLVVRSIVELTPLSAPSAREVMLTAHEQGVAQVLVTHRERAELYQEQFACKGLTVTIEPAFD